MIILFSNIKGGVGKTSTCALFGEYLHEKGYSLKVLDADIQASLSRHRDRELAANPAAIVPWEVISIDASDHHGLLSAIDDAKNFPGIVLVDMPGTVNAANLDLLYKSADMAVKGLRSIFDGNANKASLNCCATARRSSSEPFNLNVTICFTIILIYTFFHEWLAPFRL